MNSFEFCFNDKEYTLSEENLEYFQNDEENPVTGIDADIIISLLNERNDAEFTTEYYDLPCSICKNGKENKSKYYDYLEYHFYIFTKESKYVISSISKEYEGNSLDNMLKSRLVDNSCLVSITVCKNCGSYSIGLETVRK
ncbi:MAG: DUF3785 family protein [Clostridiaceae bacterium]